MAEKSAVVDLLLSFRTNQQPQQKKATTHNDLETFTTQKIAAWARQYPPFLAVFNWYSSMTRMDANPFLLPEMGNELELYLLSQAVIAGGKFKQTTL
jgi:hypothetical protein